jgi:hypothetical protein
MNERIQKLWAQTVREYGHAGQEACAQQFAEAIVKECVQQCKSVGELAELINYGEMARKTKATAASCSQMIKWRFGVE